MIHIHWYSQVEFPPERWPMEFVPRAVCRCGRTKPLGDPGRYYINEQGEWDYDDALYGPP